jgi:hypothetical protein
MAYDGLLFAGGGAFARAVGAPAPPRMMEQEALATLGPDTVYYATRPRGASNEKAKRELNFQPRPLEWLASVLGDLNPRHIFESCKAPGSRLPTSARCIEIILHCLNHIARSGPCVAHVLGPGIMSAVDCRIA